jgi:hypothetical protein
MTLHVLDPEEVTPAPDGGYVMRAWCLCAFPFVVAAPTVRGARNRLWWRVADHKGFAAAAGPGWTGREAA